MRTVPLQIFKFSELSDEAKDRAKNDYAASCGYAWADEELDSLKALTAHFDGRLKHWEIDWFDNSPSSASFDMPDMEPEEIKSRLDKLGTFDPKTLKGHGDCKLTGYCGDENAIDGFRIAWHEGERDLTQLMQAAFHAWIKAAHADCASQFEDDQFSEHCDVNNYEFTENGELH